MNPPVNAESIAELLREVVQRTDSGEYTDAISILEIARSSDPGNIYIAALKRQLEALLALTGNDDLTEARRLKLLEPLVGIAECAVRESQKQQRSDVVDPPESRPSQRMTAQTRVTESGRLVAGDQDDSKKKLEALKLLHFQRASKFVMKGEYDLALEEVQRVFVVDPDNTIAKEYVTRVQQLKEHAKHTAAGTQSGVRPARTAGESQSQRRATAWDDSFSAPRRVSTIPEHGSSSPSSRQTVAYGESLAASIRPVHLHGAAESEEHPAKRGSRRTLILVAAAVLTAVVIGAYAVFSPTGQSSVAARAEQARQNDAATLESKAIGGAGLQQQSAQLEQITGQKPQVSQTVTSTVKHSEPAAQPERTPKISGENPKPVEVAEKSSTPSTDLSASEPKPAREVPAPTPIAPMTALSANEAAKEPPAFVAVEKEPQILKLEKPNLPAVGWKPGSEDQVIVRVLIDRDGKASQTQVLKSTSKILEEAVVDAVRRSQYSPGQMGQGPVASWLTIPFKVKHPR